jgi:hypothetical protein
VRYRFEETGGFVIAKELPLSGARSFSRPDSGARLIRRPLIYQIDIFYLTAIYCLCFRDLQTPSS